MSKVFLRLAFASAVVVAVLFCYGCSNDPKNSHSASPQPLTSTAPPDPPQSTPSLELPLTFARHLGDLDAMKKRHAIRVLVVPSHSGFFLRSRPTARNFL